MSEISQVKLKVNIATKIMVNNFVIEEIELEAWVRENGSKQPPLAQCYIVKIDDCSCKVDRTTLTGAELLNLVLKNPVEGHLIFQFGHSGQLEEILLDQTIDLRMPGLERFSTGHRDRSFRFIIDNRPFKWMFPFITGLKLKQLAGVDTKSYGVWLEVKGANDREIADNECVDLQALGVERFFTVKKASTEG